MRILIVEDHQDSATLLTLILRRKGHDVRAVKSCDETMQACAAATFDILIADIGLPDCDGWELLARVRARYSMRAIAISGYGMPVDVDHSRAAGFDAHLTKPVDFETLAATLARLTALDPRLSGVHRDVPLHDRQQLVEGEGGLQQELLSP